MRRRDPDPELRRRSERYLDELFGPGAGARHAAFLDRLDHPALRDALHGYHVLESDTRHLSVADNYLLGMTVLCAQRAFGPAAMFARTLCHLGVPRGRLLEAIARLAMWTGGITAAEAAAHIQKAIADYDRDGLASLDAWFPGPAPAPAPRPPEPPPAPEPTPAAPALPGLLAGRRGVVLGVSGAGSIGYHVARTLCELGAEVAVTCRPARLACVTALAAPLGAEVHAVELDDPPSLARAFDALGAAGPLDFVVHGLIDVPDGLLARPVLDVARAEFEHVLAVAAWSLIAVCRHARPLLARSTAPRVVALTSACSHRMTPNYHVAGIAKAALESAVLYLAMELGRDGVLVNAVSASLLATDGAIRAIGERNAAATRAIQARRGATGRAVSYGDVAHCIGFLCSPLAGNLTGEIVTVDGGFSRGYL